MLAALGCPDCPTGKTVRGLVFDERFGDHLFLVSLPLLILMLIAALLYRVGMTRRMSRD